MSSNRGLIEIAPSSGYQSSMVNTDDLIIYTTLSNQAIHLTTLSNTGLHVSGSNASINKAINTAYALDVQGALNATSLNVGGASVGILPAESNYAAMAESLIVRRTLGAVVGLSSNYTVPVTGGGYVNSLASNDASLTATDGSNANITTFAYSAANRNYVSTSYFLGGAPATQCNVTGGLSQFGGLSGNYNAFGGSNMYLPAYGTLQSVAMTTTAAWARIAVFRNTPATKTSLTLVYASASNSNSVPNGVSTQSNIVFSGLNYVAPNDGNTYLVCTQILATHMPWYMSSAASLNFQINAASNMGSTYTGSLTNFCPEYKMTYASPGAANSLTTVSSTSNVATLSAPASNVYVVALGGGSNVAAVYNSNYYIDVTTNAGSNWATATLSNLNAPQDGYTDVLASKVTTVAGTTPNFRVRMTNSNLLVTGIALRYN